MDFTGWVTGMIEYKHCLHDFRESTLTEDGNILMSEPKVLVFADPNGSGKSTVSKVHPIIVGRGSGL